MTASGAALARPAPAVRGESPLIWLDMDQKELDDAYDQSVYAPNMQQVLRRGARNSELVRERLGAPKRLTYGPTSIEGLDLYASKAANAPINVFVHGGAWRVELAKDNAFHAEMLVNVGAHLAVLDFNNVIETGGKLMTMADQVRRGVVFVYKNAKSFGGDPERIYVSGHSSGGHWVGVLLTPLGEGFRSAARDNQRRRRRQRSIRLEASAALRTLELREVHRRRRGGAQRPTAH